MGNGKSLQGKVAVITGAARGIGRATALAFAREGATIVGIDLCSVVSERFGVKGSTLEDLQETGKLVQSTGAKFHPIQLDQRELKALKGAAEEIEKTFGGIDILFANAGVQGFSSLLEMEDEDWHTQIDVNLTGTANAIRAFAPFIVRRGGGRIIVTSSTQGRHGMKNGAAYSASKWGIIGLMKSAALELGQYGITVNAVIPGLIDTPLTRHKERYDQVFQEAGRPIPTTNEEEEVKKALKARMPLSVPWIEPEDVASVALFLASDAARMVSGATYDVTAGDSAHNTA